VVVKLLFQRQLPGHFIISLLILLMEPFYILRIILFVITVAAP
jgi:hypothetical protein